MESNTYSNHYMQLTQIHINLDFCRSDSAPIQSQKDKNVRNCDVRASQLWLSVCN